jgi:hypothetical protein
VLIASRELLGLFVLIDHFHFRVINPTARPTIVTAILVEALIVVRSACLVNSKLRPKNQSKVLRT